jgi:mono/diheme cytochrome c family protein
MKDSKAMILLASVALLAVTHAPTADEGPDLYAALCAACHGHEPAPLGPYPALFGNEALRNVGAIYVAIKTLQGAGNMFPLCSVASDEEVVGVANYLAAANGSLVPPITTTDIAGLRPAVGDCPPVRR